MTKEEKYKKGTNNSPYPYDNTMRQTTNAPGSKPKSFATAP